MAVGEYPFPNKNNIMILFEDIVKGNYSVPDWIDANLKDLIQQMMCVDPIKRIDITKILEHPYVFAAFFGCQSSLLKPLCNPVG